MGLRLFDADAPRREVFRQDAPTEVANTRTTADRVVRPPRRTYSGIIEAKTDAELRADQVYQDALREAHARRRGAA